MRAQMIVRKFRWVVVAAGLATIGILATAQPDGTSRLLSVQKLPENIDESMTWDKPTEADASRMTSSQEKSLFSALQDEPASPVLLAQAQKSHKGADTNADQGGDRDADDTPYNADNPDPNDKSKAKSSLPAELRIP